MMLQRRFFFSWIAVFPPDEQYTNASTACIDCPIGRYAPQALDDCLLCPAGSQTAGLAVGAKTCSPCDTGTYSSYGAPNCTLCARGRFSDSGQVDSFALIIN